MFRAKFQVTQHVKKADAATSNVVPGVQVTMTAVNDQSIEEGERFSRLGPSATIQMWVDNVEAFGLAKTFYVDFVEAE